MEFNQRMKARRIELKLSQHDVADALGVATSSYSLYESGRRQPDIKKIMLICKVLRIDIGMLLGASAPDDDIDKARDKLKPSNISERLKFIINKRALKQIDILALCAPYCKKYNIKLEKNDLSQYVCGKVTPNEDKLYILSLALGVNEVWLMGYNISSNHNSLEVTSNDVGLYQTTLEDELILSNMRNLNQTGKEYIYMQLKFAQQQPQYRKTES